MDRAIDKSRLRRAQVLQSPQHLVPGLLEWLLGVVGEGITTVERKQRSQRSRKLLTEVRQAIVKEIVRYCELERLFSLLSQAPEEAALDYNSGIPAVLRSYPLETRRQVIDLFRAHCSAPGWSICSYCGKMFRDSGNGICSGQCRKNMRNRNDWLRRKALLHKQRASASATS